MITERQQEQASLYVLGALSSTEAAAFERDLTSDSQLRELVRTLRETTHLLLQSVPLQEPPAALKQKIMQRIDGQAQETTARPRLNTSTAPASPLPLPSGFGFVEALDPNGWKALPVAGAWIKLLSVNREAGYVVAIGKLEPGTRYPAHTHTGAEDLYLLSGDLHIGSHVMHPGDFHHSDAGTEHEANYSMHGCTLLAILSTEHTLAKLALA